MLKPWYWISEGGPGRFLHAIHILFTYYWHNMVIFRDLFLFCPLSFSWDHLYAMCVMCTCWDVICVCARAHTCTIVCIRMCTQGPQYIVYGGQRTWAVSLYLPSSEKGGFCLFFSPLRIAGPQASGDSPASTFPSSCRSSRITSARYHNRLHMGSGDLESGC